ncbi:MFS transporter [Sphingobium chlorophenolicum]|uniref:Major facilitator superfamily MFS_1 n=1 Tax=Sphingobium chlorophenolicum TaxID=46429 RepID=A0A081REG8_SPHCR|nr:MFS transporter [Sphingobium chlorophenolicum]KEQ53591.1 Major facilitator superfamily MFS_1 [Sphingobium chlorophenolicum]
MNEFRRGWPLLLGAFIGISAGVSSLYFYSFGIFLKPVGEAFGWSRGQASLGPLVGTLGAAIASIPTGRLTDRFGPQRMALVSLLLLALGLAGLGLATQGLASFLLLTALLSVATVGSTPLSYTRLIVGFFEAQRGLALGLTLAATGIGAILTPMLLGPFIAVHGWRAGYLLLSAIVLLSIPLVALLIRNYPAPRVESASAPPLALIAASRPFILLSAIFLLASAAILGSVVQFPAMLSDYGLSPVQAGATAGAIGISMIVGRAICGLLLDRFAARLVTSAFFLLSALGLFALAYGGLPFALPGAIALGLSVGAEADLLAFLVARLFHRQAYGVAYGSIYAMFLLGAALGPALVGVSYELSGGYMVPFTINGGLLLLAALLALRLGAPGRSNSDISAPIANSMEGIPS